MRFRGNPARIARLGGALAGTSTPRSDVAERFAATSSRPRNIRSLLRRTLARSRACRKRLPLGRVRISPSARREKRPPFLRRPPLASTTQPFPFPAPASSCSSGVSYLSSVQRCFLISAFQVSMFTLDSFKIDSRR